jgi:hypothetical protein
MHRLRTSNRLLRSGLIAAALSISGVLVAYAALPPQAGDGQARAEAGAANGQGDSQGQAGQNPAENAGEGQSTALDQLAENQDRLFATLNHVLEQLSDNENVPDAALDALQAVIDRLGGDIGLNRAMDAVGGDTGAPDLPQAATDHPGRP